MNQESRFNPTAHAIEKYIERFAPTASKEQARRALTSLARQAKRLKVKVVVR